MPRSPYCRWTGLPTSSCAHVRRCALRHNRRPCGPRRRQNPRKTALVSRETLAWALLTRTPSPRFRDMSFNARSQATRLIVVLLLVGSSTSHTRVVSSATRAEGTALESPKLHRLKDRYRRPAQVPYPHDNAYSADRELLGRTLFFDERLSGSESISCASSNNPDRPWSDGLPVGVGTGGHRLARRTPTILNLAWAPALFWDGRADSLEEQALGPIAAAGEMNLPLHVMVSRIKNIAGYRQLFARAYPGEPIAT